MIENKFVLLHLCNVYEDSKASFQEIKPVFSEDFYKGFTPILVLLAPYMIYPQY